ncbi:ABC transporter permease [Micromonospora sp. WMMA1947]|uniref:ABC transporter permease n=1 Tax=Micromonospora sp. WMMA1947 TaxID=3015163 RepID=UPI00248CAB6B|nr:ABC transporter permease [Micromonospora sp. WMMA1947]WBC06779.1 ABC transporter permease [Micromonospora sp. WMMA1947]
MTTATAPSAYPRAVADLLPAVRDLADRLGEIPSRNRIMREFKVGAPKAQAARLALIAEPITLPDETEAEPTSDPWEYAEPAPVLPAAPVETTPVPLILPTAKVTEPSPLVEPGGHPPAPVEPAPVKAEAAPVRRLSAWPVVLIALPAFVAIWSGWVGLGGLTGFGVVHPLPGIANGFSINTAITLPIGVEVYAAYSLRAWLSGQVPPRARRFAKWSGIGSLIIGALGQVAYHLLVAAGITSAPWQITTAVACLPVAVLGMAAALAHLMHEGSDQ